MLIACRAEGCTLLVRVSPGAEGELESLLGPSSELYPDKFPCPRCNAHMEVVLAIESTDLALLDVVDLSPPEALAAFSGLGFPEERECGPASVRALMSGATVKSVKVRQVKNSHRSIIEFIELADGTRLFLGSSSHGATVYRIAAPPAYAKEALRG